MEGQLFALFDVNSRSQIRTQKKKKKFSVPSIASSINCKYITLVNLYLQVLPQFLNSERQKYVKWNFFISSLPFSEYFFRNSGLVNSSQLHPPRLYLFKLKNPDLFFPFSQIRPLPLSYPFHPLTLPCLCLDSISLHIPFFSEGIFSFLGHSAWAQHSSKSSRGESIFLFHRSKTMLFSFQHP